MVKSLSPSIPLSSSNSIPDRMEELVYSAYCMSSIKEYTLYGLLIYYSFISDHCSSFESLVDYVGEDDWQFTTVSHQIFMEVKQLFSDVFRTGAILLLILKVQQHVDLQKQMV